MDTLQYLQNKISLLEIKLDSIQKMDNIKELNVKLNEQADIISNVGSFYESAWLKLIIVISILGIAIPILIQHFQKSSLKQVTDFLSTEIKDTFNLRIEELKKSNSNQIELLSTQVDKSLEELNDTYSKLSNELQASLFYLQAKQSYAAKRYGVSIRDYVRSINFLHKTDHEKRIDVNLVNIITCIKLIKTKAAFQKILIDYDIEFDSCIKALKEKKLYPDRIRTINSSIKNLI